MACVSVCVCVCLFEIHGRGVWNTILMLEGETGRPPFHLVYLCLPILWCLHAPTCTCECMHASPAHLSLCVDARVWGNCGVLSNRERCFPKGCQNEFVTQSVNLRRKGTVERETFPRRPQSVRLIKSHGWSESWETEPECAEGTCYDSKETKKLQHVSINDSSTAHASMYLTLETAGWDSAHQRPSHHPNSQCLWRQKAGQGRLKVHQMQHDRTTLTYACLTVEQIDDWWQHTVSEGEVRKHGTRSHPCLLHPTPLFCWCADNVVFNLRRYRNHLCSDNIADCYSVSWDLQMMRCSLIPETSSMNKNSCFEWRITTEKWSLQWWGSIQLSGIFPWTINCIVN